MEHLLDNSQKQGSPSESELKKVAAMSEAELVKQYFETIPQDMLQLPSPDVLQGYIPDVLYSQMPEFDSDYGMSQHIGLHVLLERESQIRLGMLMDYGRVARMQLNQHGGTKSDDLLRIDNLGKQARDLLVMTHTRMVYGRAENAYRKYKPRVITVDDLYGEGIIGLSKATYKYDWRRGFKFTTYATWHVDHMMKKAVPEQDHVMSTPPKQYQRANQIFKKVPREAINRRDIPVICEATGFSKKTVEGLLDYMKTYRALEIDREVSSGEKKDSDTLVDFIPDNRAQIPYEMVDRRIVMEELLDYLSTELSPRSMDILCMLAGLGYDKKYNLTEIGQKYSLTRERIRQIEGEIQQKLEAPDRREKILRIVDSLE